MAQTAAARSVVTKPTEATRVAPARTTEATIAANPLYRIVMSEERSPEERRDAIAGFLKFSTKDEVRARIAELRAFAEHLQEVRKSMAKEIMGLTDTQVFGELQAVYDGMNGSLIDFDEKMQPLVDLVEAVNALRIQDKAVEAFIEIRDDRAREEQERMDLIHRESRLHEAETRIAEIQAQLDELRTPRGPFGILGISVTARARIIALDRDLAEAASGVDRLTEEITAARDAPTAESALGDLAPQKEKLREMLDLGSEEHAKRQQELVASALTFVKTSEDRFQSVRHHLGDLGKQVERLCDANGKMTGIYAILADGVRVAAEENQNLRTELNAATGNEPMLARMAREERAVAVEEYLGTLATVGAHTTETYADLASETVRVRTMRDGVQGQLERARIMGTQGVAGVAGRLSTVLQAVNSAALAESTEMAGSTLRKMIGSTDRIAQKEVIRVAMGINDANADVLQAIDALGSYTAAVDTATGEARKGVAEMRENLAKVREVADALHGKVREAISVVADATIASDETPPPASVPELVDPFASLVR